MESPGVSPVAAGGEEEDQGDMFHDQHLAADYFRLRSENVIHVGEGPHPTGGKDYRSRANSVPEEKPLHAPEKFGHRWILPLKTMQEENGYHGREPVAGGKIMGEAVENNSGLLGFF